MIPDVVNVRGYSFSELGPLFLVFFIEIVDHVLVGIGTVELKSRAHRGTDAVATHQYQCRFDDIHHWISQIEEEVAMRHQNNADHRS